MRSFLLGLVAGFILSKRKPYRSIELLEKENSWLRNEREINRTAYDKFRKILDESDVVQLTNENNSLRMELDHWQKMATDEEYKKLIEFASSV